MGMTLPPDVEAKVLELAGITQPRPAQPAAVITTRARVKLVVRIDGLSLRSEANAGGKLRSKIARKGMVKEAVRAELDGLTPPPAPRPVRVKLVRVGGKRMDDDNLRRAMKAVRDVVAEFLQVDDGDRRAVRWKYEQRSGYSAAVVIAVG